VGGTFLSPKKKEGEVERQKPRFQLAVMEAGGGEAGGGSRCKSTARPRERKRREEGESKENRY
jgi:hypothetical protein